VGARVGTGSVGAGVGSGVDVAAGVGVAPCPWVRGARVGRGVGSTVGGVGVSRGRGISVGTGVGRGVGGSVGAVVGGRVGGAVGRARWRCVAAGVGVGSTVGVSVGSGEGAGVGDGSGRGRAWPLLTGERGHYELAAGGDALPFLNAMRAMASSGGMIPEQIWDAPAIPARRLEPGRPSGSAMPLGWAHAEFVKLSMSRALDRPVDRPSATWLRYRGKAPVARHAFWFPHAPIGAMAPGARLAIALPRPATVHWGHDGWSRIADRKTEDSGLGFFVAVLETAALETGQSVEFTVRWEDDHTWLGEDSKVVVS